MSFLIYSTLFVAFGLAASFPQENQIKPNDYFVYPNNRKATIGTRLIGGDEASPHEFPFQVGLYCNTSTGSTFCGGSLVSNNFILTAAHCLDSIVSVDIILGAHQITEDENSQIRQTSNEFIIHEDWDKGLLINDIALIKLQTPVQENNYIRIVKIASGDKLYVGDHGVITGWGRIAVGQDGVTPTLRFVISQILSNDDCKAIDPYSTVIQPTHLCLSGFANNANVGTCNGDSGGPLTVDGIQVGLVTFGYRDCDAGKPSVFTRLTEFASWIREHSDVNI